MPSQIEIGAHLGISQFRVSQLMSQGVLPRTGSLDEYRITFITYLRKSLHTAKNTENVALRDLPIADIKRRRAEVELTVRMYELAQQQGEMIRLTDIAPAIERKLTALRGRLLTVGGKIAPIVRPDAPAEAQAIIDGAINDALTELSATGDGSEGSSEFGSSLGSDDSEMFAADPEAERERVGRPVSEAKSRGKRRARKMDNGKGGVSARDAGRHQRSDGSHRSGDDRKSGREDRDPPKRRRLLHSPGPRTDPDG